MIISVAEAANGGSSGRRDFGLVLKVGAKGRLADMKRPVNKRVERKTKRKKRRKRKETGTESP